MGQSQADKAWDKHVRAVGMALLRLARHTHDGGADGPVLHELRLKLEADNRTSVLVIVKAHGQERELIAFTGGPDLPTAVIAVAKKLQGGSLRWREDRPWGEDPGG